MADLPKLSACADIVRRHDRDRFTTALFAESAQREHLFALYAFNVELAKIRDVVTEIMLGRIRLQWWRESLEGTGLGDQRSHEVLQPLLQMVQSTELTAKELLDLIDAREADLDDVQPQNLHALENYLDSTSGRLTEMALVLLAGGRDPEACSAARSAGLAYGLVGVLRAMVHHARTNRLMLPADEAGKHGMKKSDALEMRGSEALAALAQEIALRAEHHLADARSKRRAVPKHAVAALFPATLSGQYLKPLRKAGFNPFDAKFGLARPGMVALTGRALIGRF